MHHTHQSAMPTLFVSHGAPTLVIDPVPTRDFLRSIGQMLPRPKAILAVSAHWDTPAPRLTSGASPHTMYDFYGFPDELYAMTYPAPGSPDLAQKTAALLAEADIPAELDQNRGLDHGAWVPLSLMYPQADIPVVQLSISSRRSTAHHLALGRAIAPLREEGVLIMASGNATHNLREVFSHDMTEAPVPYAKAFADWLTARIEAGDTDPLLRYLEEGPSGPRNHPTADHFLPLLVTLGAGRDDAGRILHDGYTYGVLSMAAYAWGL
ncbi:MAG: 4,5-DOPA dioxygenase extradiol [Humidesulfovibrio sp.]|jgi:4,5-DOPA dioxygenase extradiol|uniref:4,5-DOPA-extradiol-dioxygenase n=1 Tax=Humidesulfovibrio sp. TaxID=2910988 RepID=UPI002732AAFC|nr:4,5-DOPA dioxygenase extradiol [Humidesulfovibrio sp.]MDP2847197.1 4,5-DOPA dioxygenase extradiol [Humidesulfovibrio sp.]